MDKLDFHYPKLQVLENNILRNSLQRLKRGITPEAETLAIKRGKKTESVSADVIPTANPVSESKVVLLCASEVKLSA